MATQFDTSGSAGDIFNNTVGQILAQLDQNSAQNAQLQEAGQQDLLQGSQQINDLLLRQPQPQNEVPEEEPMVDYNAPIASQQPTTSQNSSGGTIKLANYGYASDTSPDYNSNVLRIGHANNPLKDGVSAALTKSLAKRHGLKTGDWFEIVTDKGVMKRRYDDTVPTSYRGKPLPETVDLYELRGSNKFGGRVSEIRPLR